MPGDVYLLICSQVRVPDLECSCAMASLRFERGMGLLLL